MPGRLRMISKFTEKCFYWVLKMHRSDSFGRGKFGKVSPNSKGWKKKKRQKQRCMK